MNVPLKHCTTFLIFVIDTYNYYNFTKSGSQAFNNYQNMNGRIYLNLYCLTVHRYKLRVRPSFDEIIRELMKQLKINVPGNFAYDFKR